MLLLRWSHPQLTIHPSIHPSVAIPLLCNQSINLLIIYHCSSLRLSPPPPSFGFLLIPRSYRINSDMT